jgi:TM2 domain-containing membrane protein YozV
MKRIIFLISVFSIIGVTSFAGNSDYKINDKAVDALFANAKELSIANISMVSNDLAKFSLPFDTKGEKNAVAAFVLCWFFGYFGVHRMYLGSTLGVYLGYIITAGGCGILWTIDWIFLLIALAEDGNVSRYMNNPRFFMWAD